MSKEISKHKDWDEINKELQAIGKLELKMSGIKEEVKAKKEGIEAFCINRKKEFKKNGNEKLLPFGSIVYSSEEKILLRSKAACATALRSLGLESYVKDIKEPDKEAMLKLDDSILEKVGASRKVEEDYKINVDLKKIK
jgi:phage host-nuclease inhibitor protein Gam